MSETKKTRPAEQARIFPNLAGVETCDETIVKELEEAGIEAKTLGLVRDGEVPTKYIGCLKAWSFRRAWYYWSAKGPGIPPGQAEELHKTHGKEVRVDGHCGCPSPSEWHKGFAVSLYHVDTQRGLNALARLIRDIYESNADKPKRAEGDPPDLPREFDLEKSDRKHTAGGREQIEICLGAWAENADNFVGLEVTLGIGGRKIGNISSTKVVDGTVRATVAVKDEEADLVRAFLVNEPGLLAPKIEVNLACVPVVPLMQTSEERRKP